MAWGAMPAPVQLGSGGADGFLAARQASTDQYPVAGRAGIDKINADEALNAQLSHASGHGIHISERGKE